MMSTGVCELHMQPATPMHFFLSLRSQEQQQQQRQQQRVAVATEPQEQRLWRLQVAGNLSLHL